MDRSDLKYLFLIITIFIAACIETDIYLPAFPDMMLYFSVSEEQIQSLLSWNFFGICISGPFYGPISDSIGRKKPLLFALGLFLFGSVMTIFAQSYSVMLCGRLLQGLGSGGCFTLGTALIFDVFKGAQAMQAFNRINNIIPFLMAGAPLLGGYLNYAFGFRSNFIAIALFVLLSFVICLCWLSETLSIEKRKPLMVRKIMGDFKVALTNVPFWQLTLVVSLLFAGYLAFLSGTAVLFVLEFGVSKAAFPFFQAALLGAWLVANLTCGRAIARWGNKQVKMLGTILISIGAIGFLATWFLAPRDPYILTGVMLFYAFGANWTMGLYYPESMEIMPDIKGVTASILTSLRLLIAAGIVGLTGTLYDATAYPLTLIILAIVGVSVPLIVCYELWKEEVIVHS